MKSQDVEFLSDIEGAKKLVEQAYNRLDKAIAPKLAYRVNEIWEMLNDVAEQWQSK